MAKPGQHPSSKKTSDPREENRHKATLLEKVFKAFGHRSRRQILLVLNFRGGEMTAGEIASRFSCAWPTVSRHLRVLENAGLVEKKLDGKNCMYSLNRAILKIPIDDWFSHFNL